MTKLCYDCGLPLDSQETNKEHIPAKCLFKGYEGSFTHDLITIVAHEKCNSDYSHMDDELRNFVAILTDGKDNQSILKKTFSSLARKKNERFKPESGALGVSFNYWTILLLHEKNFKGLFYHTYSSPISKEKYRIFNITEGEEREPLMDFSKKLYKRFIKPIGNWIIAGHKEVFRYKIVMLTQEKNDLIVTENVDKMIVSICAMQYYNSVFALSIGIEIEWAEKLMSGKTNDTPYITDSLGSTKMEK